MGRRPTASSNQSLSLRLGGGQDDLLRRWFVAVDDLMDNDLGLLWLRRRCGEGWQGLMDVVSLGYRDRHGSRNYDLSWCFFDNMGLDFLLGVTPHRLGAQNSLPYVRVILDSHATIDDDGYEQPKQADSEGAAYTNDGNHAIVEFGHD
jgi:hypothetical protein